MKLFFRGRFLKKSISHGFPIDKDSMGNIMPPLSGESLVYARAQPIITKEILESTRRSTEVVKDLEDIKKSRVRKPQEEANELFSQVEQYSQLLLWRKGNILPPDSSSSEFLIRNFPLLDAILVKATKVSLLCAFVRIFDRQRDFISSPGIQMKALLLRM